MGKKGYDKRMNPVDNWRFGVWRPFLCWAKGHDLTCFKVVPTEPQQWFTICGRCVDMSGDLYEPCGRCDNGCRDSRP